MPYAADDRISKAPLPDGVEISEQEYNQARDHLLSGKLVKAHSGQMFLTEKPEKRPDHEEPVWQDGAWHYEPIVKEPETPEQLAAQIPALRYEEEAKGVTLNGVRYAGDESNRQALREAVDMATKAGRTVFETWKDSDGNYLPNHPVSEVDQALDAIFQRRSDLIGLEGKYVKQVLAGEITDLSTLTWETI